MAIQAFFAFRYVFFQIKSRGKMFLIRLSRFYYVLSVMVLIISFSLSVQAVIDGTKHDFSSSGDNTGQGFGISVEKCDACHVPHNADETGTEALLWNHEITNATFIIYSSSSLDSLTEQPSGSSKLCLSCHDGTVAIDAFGSNTGTSIISGSVLIGSDLSDDHPVSFIYDTALAQVDGELYDPATTDSGIGGTIQSDLLFSNKVQCASCHNAHDNTNGYFLRVSNNRSVLCRTCHIK